MAKLVLVSGASGFIASHIVIQLLEKGYAVRGTVRNLARAEGIKNMVAQHTSIENLSFVAAELLDGESWKRAVDGCDAVMHVASPVETSLPKDPNDIIVPAVEGTRNVLTAARDAGVSRVVITSSSAAICYGYDNPPAVFTEEHHTNPDHKHATPYIQSKTYAERAAWELAEAAGEKLNITTIHPGLVLGPVLEKDYGSSAVVALKLMDGSFPGVPNLGFPVVDVRDVASMHILAMEQEVAIGQRYVCSNGFLWLGEIANILKQNFPNHKVTTRGLPTWMVKLFAKINPEVRSVMQDLNIRREHSSEKAQKELGWQPRPLKEAVVSTGQSLIDFGIV